MKIQDLIGKDFTITGSGRYLRTEEHDSLVIDVEKQLFYWNSREIYGDAVDYLTKVRDMDYRSAKDIVDKNHIGKPLPDTIVSHKVKRPDEEGTIVPFAPLVDIFFDIGKDNREYWYGRGYTDKTIDQFRLGYDGKTWYVIPIYVDGKFRNFQCRAEPKKIRPWYKSKNLNPLPFNFSILKRSSWVVLTEGPVDAIMLRQYGIPAASQTGAAGYWNNEWMHYFSNTNTIYVVYDNDKAGNGGSKKVAKALGINRTKIYNMWDFEEKYDVSDFFNDGGTKEQFMDLLDNAKFEFQI